MTIDSLEDLEVYKYHMTEGGKREIEDYVKLGEG